MSKPPPPPAAAAAESRRLSSRDFVASTVSLSTVLQKELAAYSSPCGYLDPSDPTMVTAADRKMLVDWCYGIVDHFRLPRESVAIAMSMVDQFLDMPSCTNEAARAADGSLHSQEKFQLLAIAALYGSIKANKRFVDISSDLFADICGGLYTKEVIEGMEHILFRSGLLLRCMYAPTAYQVGHSILSLLVPHVSLSAATWAFILEEMMYQTEHAVRDYYFSTQRTSTIALAALLNAIDGMSSPDKRHEVLDGLLVRIMRYFDFDRLSVISVAKDRLQRLVQGDTIVDEEVLKKSLSVDEENMDWDDFMKTFDSDCESTSLRSQPATKPRAAAISRNDSTNNKTSKSREDKLTVSPTSVPMKPKRPLTPYFIYLLIEKEFIIQSMAGEDADKSIYDNKSYLDYVPERYRKTKLSPDWYFGPGKKTKSEKRKHRKQRGKISFVELSRIISARWAKLDETNPDIKSFVQNLANQELEEYRRDMKEYNELIKNMAQPIPPSKSKNAKRGIERDFMYEGEECASQNSSRSELSNLFLHERHEMDEGQEDTDQSLEFLSNADPKLECFKYHPVLLRSKEE